MMTPNVDIAKRMADSVHASLNLESLHALADVIVRCKFKKGDWILDEGEVCQSILFIEKGMTRQFYFKHGKDLTEHIGYEDSMVMCLESYFSQQPTRLMIEALELTEGWYLPKDKMETLANENFEIATFYRKIFEMSLIESQVKADTLRFEPANERYAKLLSLHPEIFKRAPLIYIASFLQMTPETLSRVRSASLNG